LLWPAQGTARALPSDEMICWPVSARVGNVKNNDPSLIEPVTPS
jgi:putative SOS response-associated peptidase YedK